jgi:flagellar biosynthesis GTPase FlhF
MKQVLRNGMVALGMVLGSMTSATAQVSIGVWLPGVSIGVNLPVYPELVAVPGYPIYYAPRLNSNYFFYDGMYWVYQGDNWYASSWYNGPWGLIGPEVVPVYLLRVPVRYYRVPPPYFRGWQADRPPRWDEHWGPQWRQHRSGWDQWDRRSVPPRAPLPTYQRQYSGSNYPHVERQAVLQSQKYKYQPRDVEVQPHYQKHQAQGATGKPQQRESTAPRQQQAQPRATQQPQQQQQPSQQMQQQRQQTQQTQQQRQQPQQQAPRPPEQDRGSQGKGSQGSQDRGTPDKGPGHSSGQGQPKDGGKGEQGGGDHKK